jgi:hypothetical protein
MTVIDVEHVHKRYGEKIAADDENTYEGGNR